MNVRAGFQLVCQDMRWVDRMHTVAVRLLESGLFAHKDRIISHLLNVIDPDLRKYASGGATDGSPDIGDWLMWAIYGLGISMSVICFGVELMTRILK